MAAASVTGVGPGDSNGKQKPHLHSSCGCCSANSDVTPDKIKKNGCYKRYRYCKNANHKIKSNYHAIKYCT